MKSIKKSFWNLILKTFTSNEPFKPTFKGPKMFRRIWPVWSFGLGVFLVITGAFIRTLHTAAEMQASNSLQWLLFSLVTAGIFFMLLGAGHNACRIISFKIKKVL